MHDDATLSSICVAQHALSSGLWWYLTFWIVGTWPWCSSSMITTRVVTEHRNNCKLFPMLFLWPQHYLHIQLMICSELQVFVRSTAFCHRKLWCTEGSHLDCISPGGPWIQNTMECKNSLHYLCLSVWHMYNISLVPLSLECGVFCINSLTSFILILLF